MKKIEFKSRKMLRRLFNCFSLTAVAFAFQSCYGMEPDFQYDVKLSGTVISGATNEPIKGIKISVVDGLNYSFTDENGNYSFYASIEGYCSDPNGINVQFADIDDVENGHFANKTINVASDCKDEVIINVALDEKE